MPYTIKITPQELRYNANSLRRELTNVRLASNKINLILEQLNITFIGAKAQKFYQEIGNITDDVAQFEAVVNQFAEKVQNVADILESADRM